MGLELLPQFHIFLNENTVFIVNALSDRGDELKIVLHFVLPLFEIALLVALVGFLVLQLLLPFVEVLVEISDHVFFLFLLHLLLLRPDVLDGPVELFFKMINLIFFFDLLSEPLCWVLGASFALEVSPIIAVVIIHYPDLKLRLQAGDVAPVILLSPHVTSLTPHNVIVNLFIVFFYFF